MAAVGVAEGPKAAACGLMLGLSSHDISAVRELRGMPARVLYARATRGGRFISAAFDYGSFICQFETGIDEIPRFDAHLEVYATEKVVRVDYETPHIRHQPARLLVTEALVFPASGLHKATPPAVTALSSDGPGSTTT